MREAPKLIKLTDKSGKLKSPNWYIYDPHSPKGGDCRISTGYRIGTQDAEAQIVLGQYILERDKPIAREPGELMIAMALKDYYEETAQFCASEKMAKYHETRLLDFFGSRPVSHLTPAFVAKYVRERQEKGESNGTIRRDLEHLQAAINHEFAEGRITYSLKLKKPEAPRARERFLTTDEVEKLIAACKTPHLINFVKIMMATGQRPGAVEKLLWSQVDFKTGVIRFDKQTRSKTKQARPVPMSAEIYVLLKQLYGIRETPYVLEFVQANKKKGTRKARPAGNVKKAFYRACRDAGLEGVSRYTLRHSFGTQKFLDGHREKDIADIMGHTSAKTTAMHYLHTNMERLRLVVDSPQTLRKSISEEESQDAKSL